MISKMFTRGPHGKIMAVENSGTPQVQARSPLHRGHPGSQQEGSWGLVRGEGPPLLSQGQAGSAPRSGSSPGKRLICPPRAWPSGAGRSLSVRETNSSLLFPSQKKGRSVTTASDQRGSRLHVHCLPNSLLRDTLAGFSVSDARGQGQGQGPKQRPTSSQTQPPKARRSNPHRSSEASRVLRDEEQRWPSAFAGRSPPLLHPANSTRPGRCRLCRPPTPSPPDPDGRPRCSPHSASWLLRGLAGRHVGTPAASRSGLPQQVPGAGWLHRQALSPTAGGRAAQVRARAVLLAQDRVTVSQVSEGERALWTLS